MTLQPPGFFRGAAFFGKKPAWLALTASPCQGRWGFAQGKDGEVVKEVSRQSPSLAFARQPPLHKGALGFRTQVHPYTEKQPPGKNPGGCVCVGFICPPTGGLCRGARTQSCIPPCAPAVRWCRSGRHSPAPYRGAPDPRPECRKRRCFRTQ